MKRPTLVQCLCPNRHGILEIAFRNINEHAIAVMRQLMRGLIEAKDVLPWCGACLAPAETWIYQVEDWKDDWCEPAVVLTRSNTAPQAMMARSYERPRGLGSLN